jgi:hypothetical protein
MDSLTPASLRLDKKCGASAIAKDKKCRKGAGPAGRTEKLQKRIGMGLNIAGTVGSFGSLAANNLAAASAFSALGGVGQNIYGRGQMREAKRTRSRNIENQATQNMIGGTVRAVVGTIGIEAGRQSDRMYRQAKAAQEAQWDRARRGAEWARNAQGEDWAGRAGYRSHRPGGGEAPPPRNSHKGDPFKDLGVDPKASDADIKKAYARAARANHPDLGGDEEKMKKVNAAYEAIKRRRGRKDDFTLDSLTAEGVLTII